MIVDINDNIIDTDSIENISHVYVEYDSDGSKACFTVYMKTNYVKIKGEVAEWGTDVDTKVITEKRKQLYDIWSQGKNITKI